MAGAGSGGAVGVEGESMTASHLVSDRVRHSAARRSEPDNVRQASGVWRRRRPGKASSAATEQAHQATGTIL